MHLFSAGHGRYTGMARGAFSKSQRGMYQPGNIVQARWQARLAEHMGTLTCEVVDSIAAHLLHDSFRLSALHSMCVYLETLLPEREPHLALYERCEALLQDWKHDRSWLADYVRLELELLATSGFGLDLSRCAVTQSSQRLTYVSPRSGRAVSAEAGEPYREKLLRLPAFLQENGGFSAPEAQHILDGMALTRYFLERRVFEPRNMALPAACERFHRRVAKALAGQVVTSTVDNEKEAV